MKSIPGMPRICLASSGMDDMPVVNAEERLLSLLATLEECREVLVDEAGAETARLLSLAILELRMQLYQVTDSELKALCDLMMTKEQSQQGAESVEHAESAQAKALPAYLKLVK